MTHPVQTTGPPPGGPPPGGAQFPLFVPVARPVVTEPRRLPDVELGSVPEVYRPLVARLDAVRPDCARVARLAIARGEATAKPYDVEFLAGMVERMERRVGRGSGPIEVEPYTAVRLRQLVEGTFPSVSGLWEAMTDGDPDAVETALDLVDRLRRRLGTWGLRPEDVAVTTPAPDGERPPHELTQAATYLAASVCRLAKDLADQEAGRYVDDTPRRLARDYAAFERDVEAARRVLDGGPFRLPVPEVETVGDRTTWWAVVAGPGKSKQKRYSVKRGRRARAFAERDGVLGPFRTEGQAEDAAKRVTARPEDSRIGLFSMLPAREPAPVFGTTH